VVAVNAPGYALPPPRRPNRLVATVAVVAIFLATAALVVGIVSLVQPTLTPVAAAPISASPNTSGPGDTTAADRALCTAIGPLMGENDELNNTYVKLGDAGTPARDAATPKFISDTLDWISRAQPLVDQSPKASPFFLRSLQRFIDDQHLIVVDLTPGPSTAYTKTLWSDSIGAYSGPLHICDGLGIKW
jgi:hypothetical protein